MHFFANYLIEIVGQRNENFEQAFEVLWNALTLFLGLIILQQIEQNSFITHGDKMLHTLLVKRFNDLLDGQKSQRSIDKVTYFYVGDLFCIHLGTKYANFQEKIFADISGRKLQTLCIT